MSVLGKKPYITSVVEDMSSANVLSDFQALINTSGEKVYVDLTNINGSNYPNSSTWTLSKCVYALVKLDNAATLSGYLYVNTNFTTLFAFNETGEDMIIVDITATSTKASYRIINESLDINEFRRELSGITGTSSGGGTPSVDPDMGTKKVNLTFNNASAYNGTLDLKTVVTTQSAESAIMAIYQWYTEDGERGMFDVDFNNSVEAKELYSNIVANRDKIKNSWIKVAIPNQNYTLAISFNTISNTSNSDEIVLGGFLNLSNNTENSSNFITYLTLSATNDTVKIVFKSEKKTDQMLYDLNTAKIIYIVTGAFIMNEGALLTVNYGDVVVTSGGGSSGTTIVLNDTLANAILSSTGTATTISDSATQALIDRILSSNDVKLTYSNTEVNSSVEGKELSKMDYLGLVNAKEFEFYFAGKFNVVISKTQGGNYTVQKIASNEFNSITTLLVGAISLNNSYSHHYIEFPQCDTRVSDGIDMKKVIFQVLDTEGKVVTPFFTVYKSGSSSLGYYDKYFNIGKYLVVARYFNNATGGYEIIQSNNSSDPFASTPSNNLKGLVLAVIDSNGNVSNTLTDEFATKYFANHQCYLKVMGYGNFEID